MTFSTSTPDAQTMRGAVGHRTEACEGGPVPGGRAGVLRPPAGPRTGWTVAASQPTVAASYPTATGN